MSMKKNASARRTARIKKAHRHEVELTQERVVELQDDLSRANRRLRTMQERVVKLQDDLSRANRRPRTMQDTRREIFSTIPPGELTKLSERVFTRMAEELGRKMAEKIWESDQTKHRSMLQTICVNAYDDFMRGGNIGSLTNMETRMYHDLGADAVRYSMELIPKERVTYNYMVPVEELRLRRL